MARRILFVAIGLLYIASVPWYRDTGGEIELWFGLPDWVAVALGCYVAVALLNALAWQLTDVVDPEDSEDPEAEEGRDPSGDAAR